MKVIAREDESFESLLNRFKKDVAKSGILKDMKKKRHFTPKSELRREKIRAAERKRRRRASRER
ncbi:MAG: 30S ribosomal protein S21 [Chloroflexi bacterium]|nr:30S ribosomal protein S21 [Chloroflexota bacterium]